MVARHLLRSFCRDHNDSQGFLCWQDMGGDPAPQDVGQNYSHQDSCAHRDSWLQCYARPKCGGASCAIGLPLPAVAGRLVPLPADPGLDSSPEPRVTATRPAPVPAAPIARCSSQGRAAPDRFSSPKAVRGDFLSAAA